MTETELVISGIGFPRFSARGCRQTLAPIGTGELRRTVNGELRYLGQSLFHKYKTIIECQDKTVIAVNQAWIGSEVTVECCQPLWQEVQPILPLGTAQTVTLLRPPRPAGLMVTGVNGQAVPHQLTGFQEIQLAVTGDQPVFVKYEPILKMRITHFSQETKNGNKPPVGGWSLRKFNSCSL